MKKKAAFILCNLFLLSVSFYSDALSQTSNKVSRNSAYLKYFQPLLRSNSASIYYHSEKKFHLNDNILKLHASFHYVRDSTDNPFLFHNHISNSTGDTNIYFRDDHSYFIVTNTSNIHEIEERKQDWNSIKVTLDDDLFTALVTGREKYFEKLFKDSVDIAVSDSILKGISLKHISMRFFALDTNTKKWTKDFLIRSYDQTLIAYYGEHIWLNDTSFSTYSLDSIRYNSPSLIKLKQMIEYDKKSYFKRCKYIFFDNHKKKNLVCSPTQPKALQVGQKIPFFTGLNSSGNSIPMKDIHSKLILFDFWDATCAPCALSLQPLDELYSKYKNKGLEIVSLNSTDNLEKIKKYISRHPRSYTTLLIEDKYSDEFGVDGFPYFFLSDQSGNVLYTYDGYSNDLLERLSAAMDTALKNLME